MSDKKEYDLTESDIRKFLYLIIGGYSAFLIIKIIYIFNYDIAHILDVSFYWIFFVTVLNWLYDGCIENKK